MNKEGLRLCCLERKTVNISNVWLWFFCVDGEPVLLVSVPKSLIGSGSVLLTTSFTPPNDLGFLSATRPQMSWGTRQYHLQLVWHSGMGGLLWHWRWSIMVQAKSDRFSMLPVTWDENQHFHEMKMGFSWDENLLASKANSQSFSLNSLRTQHAKDRQSTCPRSTSSIFIHHLKGS